MKFFGLGMPELIIILVVVLLIFGPKNLPKLGSALGKSVKGLRSGMKEAKDEAQAADTTKPAEIESAQAAPAAPASDAASATPAPAAAPVKKVVVKKVPAQPASVQQEAAPSAAQEVASEQK